MKYDSKIRNYTKEGYTTMGVKPHFKSGFTIVLKSFYFIGVFICLQRRQPKLRTRILRLMVEVFYFCHSIYTVYLSVSLHLFDSRVLRIATAFLQVMLLLLRILLLFRKRDMVRVIRTLKPHSHRLKKKMLTGCLLCYLLPFLMVIQSCGMLVFDFERISKIFSMFFPTLTTTPDSVPLFITMATILQTFYSINFFVFPAMVILLLACVYLSFVEAHQKVLMKVINARDHQEVARVLANISISRKTHQDIESTFSPFTFICYVLAFGNIMIVIGILVTDFLQTQDSSRSIFPISVFTWTAAWFVVLTVSGSRVEGVKGRGEEVVREVVGESMSEGRMQGRVVPLLFLAEFSNRGLHFTGLGMFKVTKGLLLTTSGVFVTYGVLYASELRTESAGANT